MWKVFLKLHLAVFIAGFTGVFGRLISYDAFVLVFIRFAIATLCAYAFLKIFGKLKAVSFRSRLQGIYVGAMLAVHLIFFYLSIKLSNVSIGTVTLASSSFFTSLLEPKILNRNFDKTSLIYASLNLIGLLFIFNFDTKFRLGITVGIISAFLAALFNVYNKKFSYGKDAYTFINYEMLGGFILVLVLAPVYLCVHGASSLYFNLTDLVYLFLLATVFTVLLYLMVVQLAPKVSAFTMMLTFNLEPVYAIIIAMILFNEANEVNFSFYTGVALMICSVIFQNIRSKIEK